MTEHEVISFKPVNDVRWFSRHFAVNALVRNYELLIEYCRDQVTERNDPTCMLYRMLRF